MNIQTLHYLCRKESRKPERRRELRELIKEFLKGHPYIAPVELRQLKTLAGQFLAEYSLPDSYRDWCMIFINNVFWRKVIRRIPRDRRLLMLPFCLRHSSKCEADYDEFAACMRALPHSTGQLAESGLITPAAESLRAGGGGSVRGNQADRRPACSFEQGIPMNRAALRSR